MRPLQPIADRVAQNLDVFLKTFNLLRDFTYGTNYQSRTM